MSDSPKKATKTQLALGVAHGIFPSERAPDNLVTKASTQGELPWADWLVLRSGRITANIGKGKTQQKSRNCANEPEPGRVAPSVKGVIGYGFTSFHT